MYSAAASRTEIEGAVATELVQSLLQRDGEPLPVLSSLVDAVSERDRALLAELERLIREKRRELQREEGAVTYFLYGGDAGVHLVPRAERLAVARRSPRIAPRVSAR